MSTARIPDGTPPGLARPMRFAYADPPYPGQAKRWYGNHPDYAGEVDHGELVARLCRDYPDGWALSTNAVSIQYVLGLCPDDVRVAIWHATSQPPPGGAPGWWWCWEPVIVRGGRPGPVYMVLECGVTGTAGRFPGAKPPAFTRWMLALLGAEPADTIDDLFVGSGAVTTAIDSWRRMPTLPVWTESGLAKHQRNPRKAARDLRRSGAPELMLDG